MDGSRLLAVCRELAIEHGIPNRGGGAQGVGFVEECWRRTRPARETEAWGNKRHSLCVGGLVSVPGVSPLIEDLMARHVRKQVP
jgi:hypothetical protein